jgi:hypothetical protein
MSASTWHPVSHEAWRVVSLWAGLLTGPIVALMLLEFQYVAAYVACETRSTWFMHLATLVAVTLVGAAGVLAWRARIALPAAVDLEPTLPLSDATQIQRTNWMSVAGAAISLWFIVVILSMEIPILVLGECQ